MRGLANPDSDPDVNGDIYVPVERQMYDGTYRILAQPESFRTSPRNMGHGYGGQEAPWHNQPYNIPAPTFNSTTLSPREFQCPLHCPKKRSSTVPIYLDSSAPSNSGIRQVHDLSDPRRPCHSGTAARPVPRGTLKTADGRRGRRQQKDRNRSQ